MLNFLNKVVLPGFFASFFFASVVFAESLHHSEWDHSEWDVLLKKHVITKDGGAITEVDYAGFAKDRTQLKSYLTKLSSLSQSDFDTLSKEEQLAFLINAYNAWTIELILQKYPNLKSIKELGGFLSTPWAKSFIPLLDKTRSLDEIEHTMIRGSGRYNEPRIHFAVNCASIGCPALRAEAYTGKKIEAQLEEQTRLFFSDRSRNRLSGNTLELSSIFKWYDKDFRKGWMNTFTVAAFAEHYAEALGLSSEQVKALKAGKISIDYLDYDWRLNDKR